MNIGVPQEEPAAPTFQLNEKERQILRQMLAEDLAGFAKGWRTEFGSSEAGKQYVVVSADELQNQYERNEVAGDKKYRGKRLALRGTVAEIKRSVGENYFLTLKGGTNPFMRPMAKMADGYTDYLAGLEKGQSLQIICQGDGMLMGSAVATECLPADVWIEQMVSSQMLELPKLVGSDENTTIFVIMSVLVTERLKDTSPCFSREAKLGDPRCLNDVSQLYAKKTKTKTGNSDAKPSEATLARLRAIPGAEPYLRKLANTVK